MAESRYVRSDKPKRRGPFPRPCTMPECEQPATHVVGTALRMKIGSRPNGPAVSRQTQFCARHADFVFERCCQIIGVEP